MRKLPLLVVLAAGAAFARPYFSDPCLSPDNSEIAFVSGGDIWTVPAAGGIARLLVSHSGAESRPLYSPDGKRLAFTSTRTGNGDIYVLNLASGDLQRITFDDGLDQLDAWSRDGKFLYFSSASGDISGMNDIYRVSPDGGTPMPVSADRYVNEYFAAPGPDGASLAFTARGIVSAQWWRKGHSHLDESEIWLRREGRPARYQRVSEAGGGAKELWPMWSPDGKRLYYVSDRDGAQNIWTKPVDGAARKLTSFTTGRVLWPSIAYDGRAIVFERDFEIWKLDLPGGHAAPVPIELRGAPGGQASTHLALSNRIAALALSPDGKKVAFAVHGEIFAASSKDGGDAMRVTNTPANESDPAWAPDNNRLAFVSDRDGVEHLYLYDFRGNSEKQLTSGAVADLAPHWSHNGKLIAFLRGGSELRVLDVEAHTDRAVAKGFFEKPPNSDDGALAWSPDDKWIAFKSRDKRYFENLQIVSAEGGEARPATFLANGNAAFVNWSPDGSFLIFNTGQRTERAAIARVDLVPRTPRFREDQFRDLFRVQNPAPPEPPPAAAQSEPAPEPPKPARDKPVEVVFHGIRERLHLLPLGLDANAPVLSPDGKTVLLIADAAGQQNLYTYSLDELAKEPPVAKQLTSTPGRKRDAQWSPNGKEAFYLENGQIRVVNVETRAERPLAVVAEMDVDFSQEKREIFRQAWSYLNGNFYDPEFHGVDWAKVRERYQPLAGGAQTPAELRRIVSLMVGELNASHLGISAPGELPRSTGRLGLRFDRDEYEASGRLKVAEVLDLSPAALAGQIKPGDFLLAVDGHSIGAHTNLDELLDHKIDRRVVLAIADSPGGAGREAPLRPVNLRTEKELLYRQWVKANREYVSRISNGRLGYVHLFDMSQAALDQLFIDLDSENHSREGVVIDVRNNNGGFVNAYALDVLARRGYLNMTERGFATAPARSILGQRSLERPTVLVVNQHSLSDAEDFTEGYRSLKLGRVVGEPTAGWIIYTFRESLIDGSQLGLPRVRITANDGTDMEGHPRPVDILSVRPIGESYSGKDSQLEAAVASLLADLERPALPATERSQPPQNNSYARKP